MALYSYTHQNGTIAAGALIQYGASGASVTDSSSWKPLNGLVQTPEISASAATVDDTVIADTSKYYIPGISEGAETSLELVEYPDDADQLAFIKNAEGDREQKAFIIEFSNGIRYTFEASILGFSRASKSSEDRNTVTVSIKIVGDISRIETASE